MRASTRGGFTYGPNGVVFPTSSASILWSRDFVIEGGQGTGFVDVSITGVIGLCCPSTDDELNFTLFGESILSNLTSLPVTFGVPYSMMLSGQVYCQGLDDLGCNGVTGYVSGLAFTDSAGNPLTGLSLVPVPELSSWILLATCAIPITMTTKRYASRHRRIARF